MFSEKFSSITNRTPSSAMALDLVEKYLEKAAADKRLDRVRLDTGLIRNISKVDSSTELALLISSLLAAKILRRIVIVESPTGGGLAEFSSIDEVPDRLHDHFRDVQMTVTLSDIRTVYVAKL